MLPLVSDADLELLDVGDLGEIFGHADEVSLSTSPASLAMVACDDPTPLRRWSDSQARLGASSLSDASNLVILEAFSLPWEVDVLASPGSSEWEGSDSGVADSVVLPMSEVILANPQAKSSPAKSLLRRGFLGPRAAHPLSVLDDAPLAPASALIRRGFLGSGHVPPLCRQ